MEALHAVLQGPAPDHLEAPPEPVRDHREVLPQNHRPAHLLNQVPDHEQAPPVDLLLGLLQAHQAGHPLGLHLYLLEGRPLAHQ